MFHKKVSEDIRALDKRIDYTNIELQYKYWGLRHDLDRLVAALNMTKDIQSINRYIKKGGPEVGD